jgi:hypothetical protein
VRFPARSAVEDVRKECVGGSAQIVSSCSHLLKVQLGTRSRARSVRAKESLSCESERSIEGLLLQVCAGSKNFNTLT